MNVRHELQQAGLAVEHLTDEQVSELGRRVVQAATPWHTQLSAKAEQGGTTTPSRSPQLVVPFERCLHKLWLT